MMLLYPRIISVKFRGEILICNVPVSYFAAAVPSSEGKPGNRRQIFLLPVEAILFPLQFM